MFIETLTDDQKTSKSNLSRDQRAPEQATETLTDVQRKSMKTLTDVHKKP
jgi:hypothetical protein